MTNKKIIAIIIVIAVALIFYFLNTDTSKDSTLIKESTYMEKTKNATSISILFLGDSITEGYGIDKENSYPSKLERKLNAKLEPYNKHIEIINAGLSGDTTIGGLNRLDWFLKSHKDFIFVALGANDGLRGISTNVMKENLDNIIKKSKQKGFKVLLAGMQMPFNYGQDYREDFEKVFYDLKQTYNLDFYPFLLKGVASDENLNLDDGIHPNEKGYEVISNGLLLFFMDVFKKEGLL